MNKILFNPIALRKAKIVYNFGLSECSRVKSNNPKDLALSYKMCLDFWDYFGRQKTPSDN